jgi:hypothetical protein
MPSPPADLVFMPHDFLSESLEQEFHLVGMIDWFAKCASLDRIVEVVQGLFGGRSVRVLDRLRRFEKLSLQHTGACATAHRDLCCCPPAKFPTTRNFKLAAEPCFGCSDTMFSG